MSELSVEEKSLLHLIEDDPDLRPAFFQKVKGLKWFFPLKKEGYFKPKDIPRPKPSKQLEGYTNISPWEVAWYLEKTAPELASEKGESYCKEFLSVVQKVTEYAKKNEFSNYKVWWHFSKVLSHIPDNMLNEKAIDAVDYWLDDEVNTELLAKFIGMEWLPKFLGKQDEHARHIAVALLSKLFHVSFRLDQFKLSRDQEVACFRYSNDSAKEVVDAVSLNAGKQLGREGVAVFHAGLISMFERLDNDGWSSIWQPAIADHEQNSFHKNAENILVLGYRESLRGFIQSSSKEGKKYLQELLASKYETMQRIAIHFIGHGQESYKDLWNCIIEERFFQDNFRYEMWHFLNQNYLFFTKAQRDRTLQIIQKKSCREKDGAILESTSAYIRSSWLAAVRDYGEEERYQKAVQVAGTEVAHPDLPGYMVAGNVPVRSPYSKDELNGMEISALVKALRRLRDSIEWEAPSTLGLSLSFREAIASDPLRYIEHLDKFKDLDLSYVYSIIAAYSDLWQEKAKLPWKDIWHYLFKYISSVIGRKRFWDADTTESRSRDRVVGAVATLIKAGTRSDEHAFDEKYHDQAKQILKNLLNNQKSTDFEKHYNVDALNIAINSPRGKCVEALINLALRHCRLSDRKTNNKSHVEVWQKFQPYFDIELKRKNNVNYEFFSLVTNHIFSFLYMSNGWVMKNLGCIFDQADKKKWLCAVQGYSYNGGFSPEVYRYLKLHGYIIRALEDKLFLQDHVMKFVQDIVYSFLRDDEPLDDKNSLMYALISRGRDDEIHEVAKTISSFRIEDREIVAPRATELWPHIQEITRAIGFYSDGGRRIVSSLCCWVEFLDKVDDADKKRLMEIAPHTHSTSFFHIFLTELARISEQQPFDINDILQAAVDGMPEESSAFIGSDEQIKTILRNLVTQGKDGQFQAGETVRKFEKKHIYQPSEFLLEMLKQ